MRSTLQHDVSECVWLCRLLQDVAFCVVVPVTVRCDESAIVYITDGSVTGSRRRVPLNATWSNKA